MRIAIIGYGKIARDEHAPTIARSPDFTLVAAAGGKPEVPGGVRRFVDHKELLDWGQIDAVAICTPPAPRFEIARDCLAAGLDVLLEKPPCSQPEQVAVLEADAKARGAVLFTAWHSQFAPAVAPAEAVLAKRPAKRAEIEWREDVRRWHPGQDWVFAADGFGVFDPGINALSIVSCLWRDALRLTSARLEVPEGRAAPIAAELELDGGRAVFDWRPVETEVRRIRIALEDGGTLEIDGGGTALRVDGQDVPVAREGEYAPLYRRFATLVAERRSLVDASPLRVVVDALNVGERATVEVFSWD
jgi:predicted dehydrogenase